MLPKKLTRQAVCTPDYPIVETKQGKLRGMEVEGAFIFRGVRYAKAARFRAPEAPEPWEGVKNATAFGPCCREISTLQPDDAFTVPHFWYPQDEDCQFLNIWTQTLERDAKRPVMVWIHGGGLHHGSGVELYAYDGEELSKRGNVVVVSLNHRLNVLGYCDLSAYGEEYKYSGNLGTMDLVAALRWIRENIAAFGGDPEKVMLFGQSGGGQKILGLLQTPAADGLYRSVSLQSGVRAKAEEVTPEAAGEVTDLILKALNLDSKSVHAIDTVPFHKLALAVNAAAAEYQTIHKKRHAWAMVTDREYYMGHPANFGFRPETLDVPMLIGTVQGEFSNSVIDPRASVFGPKAQWSEEQLTMRLQERFGDSADRMRELFTMAYPDKCPADVLYTDFEKRYDHVTIAKLRAKTPGAAPVYNFLFTLELPADGGATAWHNAEEAFVFHNARYLESTFIPGVTDGLEDMMSDAWLAFAYAGDPNHPGMPTWRPITGDETATMVFDRVSGMRYGFDDELVRLGLTLPGAGFNNGPKSGIGGSPRVKI